MSERMPVSVSKRRDKTECGFKFRAKHIDRQTTLGVDFLDMGSLAHDVVATYVQRAIAEGSQAVAEDDVRTVWENFLRERREGVPDRFTADARKILHRFARGYRIDLRNVWKPEAEIALNYEGKPTGWMAPDVFLRMKLDLAMVQGHHADIEDWKTGFKVPTKSDVAEDIQGPTYGVGMMKLNPRIETVHVRFHYLRWGIIRHAPAENIDFTKKDLDEVWREWLAFSDNLQEALAKGPRAKEWQPTPGVHCGTCEVRARCPIGHEVEKLTVTDDDSAARAFARLLVLDAQRDELTKGLKVWTDKSGPLELNGKLVGFFKKNRTDIDVKRALSVAAKHGVAVEELFMVNRYQMKKLVKVHDGLEADLAAVTVDVGGTEFRVKNVKDEDGDGE